MLEECEIIVRVTMMIPEQIHDRMRALKKIEGPRKITPQQFDTRACYTIGSFVNPHASID